MQQQCSGASATAEELSSSQSKQLSPSSVLDMMVGAEAREEGPASPGGQRAEADSVMPSPASPHPVASEASSEGGSVGSAPAAAADDGAGAAGDGAGAAAEESMRQLQQLGKQLLHGWAEALAALAKLPGLGDMRVEALAARLVQLSQQASPAAALAAGGGAADAAGSAAAGDAALAPRGTPAGPPHPPLNELAGPNSGQRQAYSDPVDMFATAAKSAHLSYPELLHAFAASAEGLDDEALADYLFNLAMLCAEPPENELVVRPVLSLPQNSEEQQQYRRRQAAGAAAPVDALLAAMQQQQQQQQQPRPLPSQSGLTQEAVWQQIMAQQQQQHGGYGSSGGHLSRSGSGVHHQSPVVRSKSDIYSQYHQGLGDAQGLQGLFRGGSATQSQLQSHAPPFSGGGLGGVGGPASPACMSPTRGLQAGPSPLAKAVSAPERDLWMTAASLAAEAEQKQQEAAAAAAAAAAASQEFSFHVQQQPTSPSFSRMPPLAHSGGSGLWNAAAGSSGASLGRSGGGSSAGGSTGGLRDFSY